MYTSIQQYKNTGHLRKRTKKNSREIRSGKVIGLKIIDREKTGRGTWCRRKDSEGGARGMDFWLDFRMDFRMDFRVDFRAG